MFCYLEIKMYTVLKISMYLMESISSVRSFSQQVFPPLDPKAWKGFGNDDSASRLYGRFFISLLHALLMARFLLMLEDVFCVPKEHIQTTCLYFGFICFAQASSVNRPLRTFHILSSHILHPFMLFTTTIFLLRVSASTLLFVPQSSFCSNICSILHSFLTSFYKMYRSE